MGDKLKPQPKTTRIVFTRPPNKRTFYMEYHAHYTSKLHWTDEEEEYLVDIYNKLQRSAPIMASSAGDKFWSIIRYRMHSYFKHDSEVDPKDMFVYEDRVYALLTLDVKEKEAMVNEQLEGELPWDDEFENNPDDVSDEDYYSDEEYYY